MKISGRARLAVVVAAAVAVGVSACSSSAAGGSGGSGAGSKKVNIVAFSVPKPAYDAAEAAFQKTAQGKGVTFGASYGPSGSQATAITTGQPADYVGLSLEPDMAKLVPQFVASDWDTGKTKGIVSTSIVVITVRKGNPLHITSWDDLTKPGVKIVTPDPATSGSAKWNLLAAYEHVLAEGKSQADAEAYLTAFFKNVVSKPASGSDAMQTFLGGTGNVLISYENEAIHARQTGSDIDYVIPPQTVLIENPGAVTKNASTAAKNFLSFVESAAGQKIFAANGFRPVDNIVSPGTVQGANDPANPYPAPQKLLTVAQLGGWDKLNDQLFGDPDGIITKIEAGS